jgi:hypothetical protein
LQTFERFTLELYPSNDEAFEEIALRLFQFQAAQNEVYRNYLAYIGVSPTDVTRVAEIPFLPITLFKSSDVRTGQWIPEVTYVSSGTTGATLSKHAMPSKEFYFSHSRRIFESVYGPLSQYQVLCLLPSYLERAGSSLVAMASHFISQSGIPESGFFLNDVDRLIQQLGAPVNGRIPLLLGVSFALLDLAEQYEMDLSRCVVMETGGMKGRRPEITRAELHEILKARLNVDRVHSEYGMTELTSQAYAPANGVFGCPPSMRVYFRELNDPFAPPNPSSGVINIIDLANAHSCAFVETQDLGKGLLDGHFEVVGRMDASDVRGCNLLVE